MISRNVKVEMKNGLEARPVAMLVQVASQYNSKITIKSENRWINAKSIMGMMGLGLTNGESVEVCADGDDEEKALDGIEEYLSSGR